MMQIVGHNTSVHRVWRLELVIPNVAPKSNATAVSQSAPAETAPIWQLLPLAETAPTPADTPAEGNASDILAMIPKAESTINKINVGEQSLLGLTRSNYG